jgi:uncharacterized protein YecT (DUF1311 family)
MKTFAVALLATVSLGINSIRAQDAEVPKKDSTIEASQCLAETETVWEIGNCYGVLDTKYGKELQKIYDGLIRDNLSPEAVKLLRESQRSWLKYQETNCNLKGRLYWDGAAEEFAVRTHCLFDSTINRLKELKGYQDHY